jgi:type III restriction enzyme
MPSDKFAQIANNENRALSALKDIFIWCIYELIVNKVSYQLREIKVKTALTDSTGALLASLPASLCGNELYPLANAAVQQRSLYNETFMPVDSQPERDAIDESNIEAITVFAKLPKINIPTPVGNYNPDFGYTIGRDLYLVVEAKGYDSSNDLGKREGYKIASAKHFFSALKASGVNVTYKTKLNGEGLAELIASIDSD